MTLNSSWMLLIAFLFTHINNFIPPQWKLKPLESRIVTSNERWIIWDTQNAIYVESTNSECSRVSVIAHYFQMLTIVHLKVLFFRNATFLRSFRWMALLSLPVPPPTLLPHWTATNPWISFGSINTKTSTCTTAPTVVLTSKLRYEKWGHRI